MTRAEKPTNDVRIRTEPLTYLARAPAQDLEARSFPEMAMSSTVETAAKAIPIGLLFFSFFSDPPLLA